MSQSEPPRPAAMAAPRTDAPDPSALEEFKNQVRIWLELDNSIKQLQQLARERRLFKKQLTDKILLFMSQHNIDDLNTRDGRLVYKTSFVKSPLTQATIRQRVEEALTTAVTGEKCMAITSAVFSRDRSERASLSLRKVRVV